MAKKGLITSLILGAVLTLSLGIFTLVTALVGMANPVHNNFTYAYTSDQTITAFSNVTPYEGSLEIQYAEGQEEGLIFADDNTCVIDSEKEFFVNANAGDKFTFTAVVTTDKKGSTDTIVVNVFKQGTGESADNQHYVANAEGLCALEGKLATVGFISLVDDIDLAGIEWKGLALEASNPFSGTFNGNGYAVNNMNIHVTANNCVEFKRSLTDQYGTYDLMSIGFFRNTELATITGLSLTNANITIDNEVLAAVNPEQGSILEYIRVGLLVGDARYTTIDGAYTRTTTKIEYETDWTEGSETFGQEIAVEKEVEETCNAEISGTINGYSFGRVSGDSVVINGMGGIAGVVYDYHVANMETRASVISNYLVNLNVVNTNDSENVFIGAVAGEIFGDSDCDQQVELTNLTVNLTSNAKFNSRNHIGAVAGKADRVDAKNIETAISIEDTSIRYAQFASWYNSANKDLGKLTDIAGIVADATNSVFANIKSNANITSYSNTSAGFVHAKDCAISDVLTSGDITGYSATGLAQFLYESNVEFNSDLDTEVIASDVKLSGYYTAALADYARNSNIVAKGAGAVKVNVTINAKGKVAEGSTAIQNTLHSAGLVGYFYADKEFATLASTYTLSGFVVNANINNGTDMAGLVAYLGNDVDNLTGTTLVIDNCTVVANIESQANSTESYTHKVGGAVATIYGNAQLDNVNVQVQFNAYNQTTGNKAGAAMFGGLVARIGGENVLITNCSTTGSAYINHTQYTKSFGSSTEYEQILAGGLIGAIADFSATVNAGKHPVYGENTLNLSPATTVDHLQILNTNTITITDNTVALNIVIDFAKEHVGIGSCMGEAGYRARSAGSLIGLVMNGLDTNTDGNADELTKLDLSSNTITGSIIATDDTKITFTFHTKDNNSLSSMGYGKINNELDTPACVGSSYDLVSNEGYDGETLVFPAA